MSSGNDRLDKAIPEARRNVERRAAGYRGNTSKVMAPSACGTGGGYAEKCVNELGK